MEQLQEVKRCPNPECTRKQKVYLNGKTHCDACHTALVKSKVGFTQSSIDLLQSLSAVRSEVDTLIVNKSRHGP